MTSFGKILNLLGAIRVYRNGDGHGFIWRWYHPLAWVLAPLALIASGLLEGFPQTWKYREQIGFRIDPYFTRHNINVFDKERNQ
jgi:hypothetical protein